MKIKDVVLQHFGDFEPQENVTWGTLDSKECLAFTYNNEWCKGYFSVIGIEKGNESVFSEITLEEAFELSKNDNDCNIFFSGCSDVEEVDFNYEDLDPEMLVYPVDAIGSLAHEINFDEGQPKRAAMNYLLDQGTLVNMSEDQFLKLIIDSAEQLLQDFKEEEKYYKLNA